jgi:NADH-quinone oxidoreductase subunit L
VTLHGFCLWVLNNAWIVPALPVAAFVLILFFGKHMPKKGPEVGITAVSLSFAYSIVVAQQVFTNHADVSRSWTWFTIGTFDLRAGLRVDGLTAMMLVAVCFVSLMVQIYSTGYMHGDARYTFFFATLSLFTASMLILVLADNLFLILIGWELVGLCSYILIGHYFEEEPNVNAAMKAFITTRIGDIGFMIGIFVLASAAKTFNIAAINEAAKRGQLTHLVVTAGAILLFCGAVGKSAQFPLHVWLPDAMAGPTPVSALIHAATMVVAGVYLVARTYPIFVASGVALHVVTVIGTITLVIAGLLAFVQDDIKRVLAYSTVSQLGYMIAGLGVGAWTGSVFHLFTHASFKALLFLGSGSVIHACRSNNMSEMGGLRKVMPTTFWTFIVGSAALAGIPPLAGFFSKDDILGFAFAHHSYGMWALGTVGAALTATYMARACYLTFFGEYRGEGHPHESPRSMTVPLVALAVPSGLVGLVGFPGLHGFGTWVTLNGEQEVARFEPAAAVLSVALALGGIAIGTWIWLQRRAPAGLLERFPILRAGHDLLVGRYYLDWLYFNGIVHPTSGGFARAANWSNQHLLDWIVNGFGRLTSRYVASGTYWVDQKVIDGMVNGTALSTGEAGGVLRYVQSGRVQQYAAILFLGVAVLALALLLSV